MRFLISSGQNIVDIKKYSLYDTLGTMAYTLKIRNIIPTAPDTLSSFNFEYKNPLILNKCPHVYIITNQEKYKKKRITGNNGQRVLFITIPSFRKTKNIVILNIDTMECSTTKLINNF